MKIIILTLLATVVVAGCAKPTTSYDLDYAKEQLEAHIGGTWEKKATNPDIGMMLSPTALPPPLKAGFYGVIPFSYDGEGGEKIDLYISTCNAPLFVLGHNDDYTVITYCPKTHETSQKIFETLKLKETNRPNQRFKPTVRTAVNPDNESPLAEAMEDKQGADKAHQ